MKNRILKVILLSVCMVSVGVAVLAVTAQDNSADVKAKIDNAMSAAPRFVAEDATILDNALDANGKPVVLRAGTNGWSCFPDDLTTPMNNPACYDEVWMTWIYAAMAGEDPSLTVTKPGFSTCCKAMMRLATRFPLRRSQPRARRGWLRGLIS